MKMTGIIGRHVKRKIAAAVLASMLINQFPATVFAEPLDLNPVTEQAAPKEPKTVTPQTKISEIQKIMNKYKIHNVLVVDEGNHLLGIVDRYACVL